jgi:hypothetical protein
MASASIVPTQPRRWRDGADLRDLGAGLDRLGLLLNVLDRLGDREVDATL